MLMGERLRLDDDDDDFHACSVCGRSQHFPQYNKEAVYNKKKLFKLKSEK